MGDAVDGLTGRCQCDPASPSSSSGTSLRSESVGRLCRRSSIRWEHINEDWRRHVRCPGHGIAEDEHTGSDDHQLPDAGVLVGDFGGAGCGKKMNSHAACQTPPISQRDATAELQYNTKKAQLKKNTNYETHPFHDIQSAERAEEVDQPRG